MQSYFFAIAYRVPLVVQNGGAGVAGPGGGGARSRGGEGVRPRGVSVSLCVKKSLKNLGSPSSKIFSICACVRLCVYALETGTPPVPKFSAT